MLKGKNILLGITGSIAAYKAAMLARFLLKEGATVKVVMTEMAKHFITPLTMATLSKNPVLVEFYNPENGDWNSHVSLGEWADLFLIAPASANTLAKMATGVADNLLLTTYLSAKCPVAAAPAMDLDMYRHKATQSVISVLKERGVYIIEPTSGELASGLEGKGRMEEPEVITEKINSLFYSISRSSAFKGKKVLITAGPTIEPIDPVRFISNHSSGKMGYAIAEEFSLRGASVTLISGPVSLTVKDKSVKVIPVTTASQMHSETTNQYNKGADIVIFAAAVSDYTPNTKSQNKIKRKREELSVTLTPTADISASLGNIKQPKAIHVGFALETENELENATAKLKSKHLDAIVINSLNDKGAGFAFDTNKVSILSSNGELTSFSLKSKKEVASDIADYIENLCVC